MSVWASDGMQNETNYCPRLPLSCLHAFGIGQVKSFLSTDLNLSLFPFLLNLRSLLYYPPLSFLIVGSPLRKVTRC